MGALAWDSETPDRLSSAIEAYGHTQGLCAARLRELGAPEGTHQSAVCNWRLGNRKPQAATQRAILRYIAEAPIRGTSVPGPTSSGNVTFLPGATANESGSGSTSSTDDDPYRRLLVAGIANGSATNANWIEAMQALAIETGHQWPERTQSLGPGDQ